MKVPNRHAKAVALANFSLVLDPLPVKIVLAANTKTVQQRACARLAIVTVLPGSFTPGVASTTLEHVRPAQQVRTRLLRVLLDAQTAEQASMQTLLAQFRARHARKAPTRTW
jgi:hypothetical protein